MRKTWQVAMLSGALTGVVISIMHAISLPQPIQEMGLVPLVAWFSLSFITGGLSGAFGGFLSAGLLPHWSRYKGLSVGAMFGAIAYGILFWALLGCAIANQVYYP